MLDDLGVDVGLSRPARRIVSLVPSLTEAIAVTCPAALVGATDWCVHPPGLDVVRLRGTKNPDVATIVSLRPGLVVANVEENREADVVSLRRAGVPVWVTDVRDVLGAISSLRRLLTACGADDVPWLDTAAEVWARPHAGERRTAAVPVWRRPWMALGRDTFAGDVLSRLGIDNALAASPDRYPRTTPAELLAASPDLVVLPDEPYAFHAQDGPEAFPGVPCALVDGRMLTWYGPSLVAARDELVLALRPENCVVAR